MIDFTSVSNQELVARAVELYVDERRVIGRLIAYLVEIEKRGIPSEASCPSLYVFCYRELGMSEGAAFRRAVVAELAAEYPRVLDGLEAGRLHVSGLALVQQHATPDNAHALIDAALGKTKRQITDMLAALPPRTRVASKYRRRVAAGPVTSRIPSTAAARAVGRAADQAPPTSRSPSQEPETLPKAPETAGRSGRRTLLEALAEGRRRLGVTIRTAVRAKLERARDRIRHLDAPADVAVIIEAGLDRLLETIERTIHGAAKADPEPAVVTSNAAVAASDAPRADEPAAARAVTATAGSVSRKTRRVRSATGRRDAVGAAALAGPSPRAGTSARWGSYGTDSARAPPDRRP